MIEFQCASFRKLESYKIVNGARVNKETNMLGLNFINLFHMYSYDQYCRFWLSLDILTYCSTNIIYV